MFYSIAKTKATIKLRQLSSIGLNHAKTTEKTPKEIKQAITCKKYLCFLLKTVDPPKIQQIAFTAFCFLKKQEPKELVIKHMQGQQEREQAKVAPVRLLIVLVDFMISAKAAGPV